MLIDRAWVISRNEDIWAVDRDTELYAADRGHVNMWKIAAIDPMNGGKPAMLTMDGDKHREPRPDRIHSAGSVTCLSTECH
jgi:cholest-4-en-3-one 26-monooxygenase